MSHRLQEGAVIVADSHYSPKNPHFLEFLQKIYSNEIATNQLILLGDNFDLLIPRIKKTVENNRDAIDLINKISEKKEVIYFEGNHDFLLKKLFPKVKLFSFFAQPVEFEGNEKRVLISHGDRADNLNHTVTTTLFRNSLVVNILDLFTLNFLNNRYVDNLTANLQKKEICTKIENFQKIVKKRLANTGFDGDYVIEGHFHQGERFLLNQFKYLNVESFACNQSYLVVEYSQNSIDFLKKTL